MDNIGHNSVAGDRLESFIERIERLEEEKAGIQGDIKELYAEAKGEGFDTKTMRKVVALRKLDQAERQEQEALLDTYMNALGMLSDTPLGEAAKNREFGDAKPRGPKKSFKDEVRETLERTFAGTGVTVERDVPLDKVAPAEPKQADIEQAIADKADGEMPDLPPALDRRKKLQAV